MLTQWWRAVRGPLVVVLGAFLALAILMALASFVMLQARQVTLAEFEVVARQRFLAQQLAWQALTQPAGLVYATLMELDQNFPVLREGGLATLADNQQVRLPAAPPARHAQLLALEATWATVRAAAQPPDAATLTARLPAFDAALATLQGALAVEIQAQREMEQNLQWVFFGTALAVLWGAGFFIWRRIVQPLAELHASAQRLLHAEAAPPPGGHPQLSTLYHAFETLRAEVTAARNDLEKQVAQRTRELTTVFEISQEMVAQRESAQLLQSVAEHARTLAQAETVAVCLLEPAANALTMAAQARRVNSPLPVSRHHTLTADPALRVINNGETMTSDAGCAACRFLQAQAPGMCLVAPLRAGDVTLGALCAVRAPNRPFDTAETRAFTLLANAAAVTLTNARLIETAHQQTKEKAALAEREQLAAELHDHLAQTLGFMKLKTEQIQVHCQAGEMTAVTVELARLQGALETAYGEVRAVLTGLREPPIPAQPLGPQLAQCARDFQADTAVVVELHLAEVAMLQLPPVAQAQVVHIVREALHNIRRHARARHVTIRAEGVADGARFIVQDDGQGFDQTRAAGDHHLGLRIMQTRAERSGGVFQLTTRVGQGTTVSVTFPPPLPHPH